MFNTRQIFKILLLYFSFPSHSLSQHMVPARLLYCYLHSNGGLIHDQRYRTDSWCRNADAGLRELTTRRLRCASSQFFLLLQISNLQISSLNSSEIRLCIHFIFTNLNWGIPYYICKRELTVSLDNVSTQAGKNV